MDELTHGFRIDQGKCEGCLACMRACPTHAVRVKEGKARLFSDLCIDCGSCLKVCTRGSITATTRPFDEIGRFKVKVAVPSPVLFGQFPAGVTPDHIVRGLLAIGFDEVWDYQVEIALVTRAVIDYIENWKGQSPLISVNCPVVVRLLQVSYPRMVEQLVSIHPPREIAGRGIKRWYPKQTGIPAEDIAAIYISPCQARTVSILQPAEGVRSHLDGAVGISEVYNGILSSVRDNRGAPAKPIPFRPVRNSDMLRWATSEGLGRILSNRNYMSVTGLSNVIQVFDDIEKGKLRNIDFLEAYSCWGGCTGGNLTVDNRYVTLTKLKSLMTGLPCSDLETDFGIARRHAVGDPRLEAPVRPRPVRGEPESLKARVKAIKDAEDIRATLPGLDCGLCGAPACQVLARDIARGEDSRTQCVFLSRERLEELRRIYVRPRPR